MDDLKKPHGEDCKCTYCDNENVEKIWNKDATFKSMQLDNLDATKNKCELHVFVNQSKEVVKDLLKKAETEKTLSTEFAESQKEKCPTPKLLFDNDNYGLSGDNLIDLDKFRQREKSCIANEEISATWRCLSGVKPDEKIPSVDKLHPFLERVLDSLADALPKLTLEWENGCYDRTLTVNGARTCISAIQALNVVESIESLVNTDEAEKIVAEIVTKKVTSLFI